MAKAPKPDGCHNCRYVDKTGHPRGPWKCTYEVVLPPLPGSALRTNLVNAANAHQNMGMWPGDGHGCPVRAALEKEETR